MTADVKSYTEPGLEDPTPTHHASRPLKFVKDRDGNGWLCDKHVDPVGNLAEQGCWRCEDMAFPAGGR